MPADSVVYAHIKDEVEQLMQKAFTKHFAS